MLFFLDLVLKVGEDLHVDQVACFCYCRVVAVIPWSLRVLRYPKTSLILQCVCSCFISDDVGGPGHCQFDLVDDVLLEEGGVVMGHFDDDFVEQGNDGGLDFYQQPLFFLQGVVEALRGRGSEVDVEGTYFNC